MKYIIAFFLLVQVVVANNEFSSQESSVFNQKIEEAVPEQVNEEPQNSFVIPQVKPTQELTQEDIQTQETAPSEKPTQASEPEVKEQPNESSVTQEAIEPVGEQTREEEFSDESSLYPVNSQGRNRFQEARAFFTSDTKNLYVSYIYYPKNIYKNQRFEVVIKTLVTTDEFDSLETHFIDAKNMRVLNPEAEWKEVDTNTFENRYYFKALESDFVMPTFQVLMYRNGYIYEESKIKPEEVIFSELGLDDEKFSNVIAKSLKVNAYKSKQYNNNELIAILDVEAQESNLEDFYVKGVEEQGFSSFTDDYPNQNMIYYVVLPIHNKTIEFNYYSTLDNSFKKVTIPIVLANELVSTQTDLNPNNSNLLYYKKIALSVLALFLLILFIWKRRYVYLIALLLVIITLIIYIIPNKQAMVKNNSIIYILPTKNSTVFFKTSRTRTAEVVMKRGNFVKVIITINNKKIIGWIKDKDLVKN